MQNYSVPLIGLPGKQTGVKYCNDEKTVESKLKYLLSTNIYCAPAM